MKVPKCASSTTSGVARRVASRLGLHGVTSTGWIGGREPGVWASHGALATQVGVARAAALDVPSFFFTLVREPLGRCLSEFYFFRAGRADAAAGAAGDAARKVEALRGCRDFAHAYVRPSADASVNDTLSFYDLIGVAERFDESVVLLADALGVALEAVLYLSSKNSSAGGVHLHGGRAYVAHPPLESEPPEVLRELASGAFAAANADDAALWAAATARIDARMREPRLAAKLAAFRAMLARAQRECGAAALDPAHSRCYQSDAGCGYECLDANFTPQYARRGANATAHSRRRKRR